MSDLLLQLLTDSWSFWEEKAEVDWLAELRDVLNRAYGASSKYAMTQLSSLGTVVEV